MDELTPKILNFIKGKKEITAAAIMEKFSIGYSRASRILLNLEKQKVVGPTPGGTSRKIL